MLVLKNLKKKYKVGENVQVALDNVSLSLRDNEFVAILGPSGSGKTTLLNLIGGLDRYDEGDIVIDGKSTKSYTDRDWDSYRNHTIGFVFQSYNLIEHQSVLSNVELALTISGIGRSERRRRAVAALKEVGLEDHMNKRPNQLSGGQAQRVAIARALVNNPSILLADEPTGALDSETSVSVMELLKNVAKSRLVVMVTHNSDLARDYATRTVVLKDGHIVSDSAPFEAPEAALETSKKGFGRSSMSFGTALSLSFNNLRTKKGRTLLTAFAGSIGIIGIALILALSTGVNRYINDIQKSTMSSYPITIDEQTYDLSAMMGVSHSRGTELEHELDGVYTNTSQLKMASAMTQTITNNNLSAFKEYLESPDCEISQYLGSGGIRYSYNVPLNVFAYDSEGTLVNASSGSRSMGGMATSPFSELLNTEILEDNYDLLYGRYPENENEIVMVVDSNNEVPSTVLYQVGLLPMSELKSIMTSLMMGKSTDVPEHSWSYDQILGHRMYLVDEGSMYSPNENGTFSSVETPDLENALTLSIVGVIKAKEDASLTSFNAVFGYTSSLTSYLIEKGLESPVVKAQMANSAFNIVTGEAFEYGDYEDALSSLGYVDISRPSSISIYADSFSAKEEIGRIIDSYNDSASEEDKITYTDYVKLLMSSVTNIVDIISYVLIAFVAVSLVVSSIMIGIITYISVLERTKEIGILRALGASKGNISQVFNAETFIVGLVSGAMGILISELFLLPVNAIIHAVADTTAVNAVLPLRGALILVALSVLLTLIGGFIPSRKAAKKDPVLALRSE